MPSIRSRFVITAVITTCLALAFSAYIFTGIFSKSYLNRIDLELTELINQIASAIEFDDKGFVKPLSMAYDRRFEKAYSGTYWQIEDRERDQRLRSVSLWDYVIPLPLDEHEPGTVHRYSLSGPNQSTLIIQERLLIYATPDGSRSLRIAAAIDDQLVDNASKDFALSLVPFLFGLALFLIAASVAQLIYGLKPISLVSDGLRTIRDRRSNRLHGQYPDELQAMVDLLNQLLENQENTLEKARQRASDLAHGLKTPLTVLAYEAKKLREKGNTELADEIESITVSMQNHVDSELTRSRIVDNPQQRKSNADVNRIVGEIIRTLQRAPRESPVKWIKNNHERLLVAMDPHDIRELLGNLLENAWKWADSEIRVSTKLSADKVIVVIEDDGPGVEPEKIQQMTNRGTRLDNMKSGTGLGLSIVAEVVDVYELDFAISNRAPHGLRATLELRAINHSG